MFLGVFIPYHTQKEIDILVGTIFGTLREREWERERVHAYIETNLPKYYWKRGTGVPKSNCVPKLNDEYAYLIKWIEFTESLFPFEQVILVFYVKSNNSKGN